jgi:ferredoxin
MDTPCIVCEEICPTSPKAIWCVNETITKNGFPVLLQKPKVDPQLCIGCGACEKVCPVKDKPAVYVTPIGESRSRDRKLLLDEQQPSNDARWGHGQRPDAKRVLSQMKQEAQAATEDAKGARVDLNADPMGTMLPGAVGGFVPKDPPRAFTGGNLYEYMNGAAPGYKEFGFQRMVVCEYALAGKMEETIVVEVFDMGTVDGALGKYSKERDTGATFLKVGGEGYMAGGVLAFYAGKYYVKLTAFEDNADTQRLSKSFAESIAAKIGAGAAPTLTRFPKEGRVPHSERYVVRDLAGVPEMTGGWAVDFTMLGGRPYTLHVAAVSEESVAKGAMDVLRQKFPRAESASTGGEEILRVGGTDVALVAIRKGKDVAILKGRLTKGEALTAVRKLLAGVPGNAASLSILGGEKPTRAGSRSLPILPATPPRPMAGSAPAR